MTSRLIGLIVTIFLCASLPTSGSAAGRVDRLLPRLQLPPGFKISVFAEVPRARSMAIVPDGGTVFVGSRRNSLHRARDTNHDGIADDVVELSDRLYVPNGIAYHGGTLYIAEQHRIVAWRNAAQNEIPRPFGPLETIFNGLPDKSWHGWRYLAFGPDGKLYVSVGSPCNICEPQGLEGTILRLDPDGKNVAVVASGVRNSVGFDWHPKTGDMFFTDNGADNMGDDVPPDELNHVTQAGQFFGFPYYGGGTARTSDFENKPVPAGAVPPVVSFQAHSANLGVHFYRGTMFPAEYRNDAFVAQHGSWNRSSPVGYQLMRIRFDDSGKAIGKDVFASGWLRNGRAWGRPVDIKELPDGSLLVSDDFAGVLYRIVYDGP